MTEQSKNTDITADTTVDDTEGHFYQAKDEAEDDAEGHRTAQA